MHDLADRNESFRYSQQILRRYAKPAKNDIKQAVRHAELHTDRTGYHHGYKMRENGDSLRYLFQSFVPKLMEHQGQSDAGASAHHQSHHAHDHGIAEQSPYIRIAEKTDKMLQPYPFTPQNPLRRIVISECDRSPVHGIIAENKIIGDNRQDKEIQPPVLLQIFLPGHGIRSVLYPGIIYIRSQTRHKSAHKPPPQISALPYEQREGKAPSLCHRNPFYLISGFLYKPTG